MSSDAESECRASAVCRLKPPEQAGDIEIPRNRFAANMPVVLTEDGPNQSPVGVFPIVIVMPSGLHSSSARSMLGRCPWRRTRNAFVDSRLWRLPDPSGSVVSVRH